MNLKTIRKQRNMRQEDIANYLNVKQATYSGYESGKYEPTIETLCKLANYYNVSIDYLIGRENKNEIDISALSNKKNELIKELVNVPDNMISELHAYLKGMQYAEKERQDIINEITKLRGNK